MLQFVVLLSKYFRRVFKVVVIFDFYFGEVALEEVFYSCSYHGHYFSWVCGRWLNYRSTPISVITFSKDVYDCGSLELVEI